MNIEINTNVKPKICVKYTEKIEDSSFDGMLVTRTKRYVIYALGNSNTNMFSRRADEHSNILPPLCSTQKGRKEKKKQKKHTSSASNVFQTQKK